MLAAEFCDSRVINIGAVQIFRPDFAGALPDVPGRDARAVFSQAIERRDATAINPIHVVTKTNQLRISLAHLAVHLARAIRHFRHVIVNAKFHSEFF